MNTASFGQQHGNDRIALCANSLLVGTLCTGSFQLLHRSLTAVIHQQIRIVRLQQFFAIGLPIMPTLIKPIFSALRISGAILF